MSTPATDASGRSMDSAKPARVSADIGQLAVGTLTRLNLADADFGAVHASVAADRDAIRALSLTERDEWSSTDTAAGLRRKMDEADILCSVVRLAAGVKRRTGGLPDLTPSPWCAPEGGPPNFLGVVAEALSRLADAEGPKGEGEA